MLEHFQNSSIAEEANGDGELKRKSLSSACRNYYGKGISGFILSLTLVKMLSA